MQVPEREYIHMQYINTATCTYMHMYVQAKGEIFYCMSVVVDWLTEELHVHVHVGKKKLKSYIYNLHFLCFVLS